MVVKDLRPSKSTFERWGWYARAGRRKVNEMNKNKQKKRYMIDWDVMQEQPEENLIRCPPPLNGRTLHTWHRWQAGSVNNFWKSSFMLFKTFQHLHLTLDGMADLWGMLYQNRPLLDASKQRQHNFGAAKGQLGVCQGIRGVANAVAYDQQRC